MNYKPGDAVWYQQKPIYARFPGVVHSVTEKRITVKIATLNGGASWKHMTKHATGSQLTPRTESHPGFGEI